MGWKNNNLCTGNAVSIAFESMPFTSFSDNKTRIKWFAAPIWLIFCINNIAASYVDILINLAAFTKHISVSVGTFLFEWRYASINAIVDLYGKMTPSASRNSSVSSSLLLISLVLVILYRWLVIRNGLLLCVARVLLLFILAL